MNIDTAYIHIPFCKSKCFYCDFNSYANKDESIGAYFDALYNEIISVGSYYKYYDNHGYVCPLKSIYIGGGTPSHVPSKYIVKTLETLRSCFCFSDDAEITIECNPGTAGLKKFRDYKDSGINRISIGLQSTSDILLKNLGRIHTLKDFEECIYFADMAGITNKNADLMFGLPGQKIDDVTDSIDFLIEKEINHISFYSLILEKGTPFFEKFEKYPDLLPSEDMERDMYHFGVQELEKNGYLHYEISNLAKPGYFCKQNISYWKTNEYIGFGAGAHSYQQSTRYGNIADIDSYIKKMNEFCGCSNSPCAAEDNHLTQKEREQEFFMLGFRLLEGIDDRRFRKLFGKGMDEYLPVIEKLSKAGYIVSDNDSYRLSDKGIDFANQVFIEFV